jgi:hypothetical protein
MGTLAVGVKVLVAGALGFSAYAHVLRGLMPATAAAGLAFLVVLAGFALLDRAWVGLTSTNPRALVALTLLLSAALGATQFSSQHPASPAAAAETLSAGDRLGTLGKPPQPAGGDLRQRLADSLVGGAVLALGSLWLLSRARGLTWTCLGLAFAKLLLVGRHELVVLAGDPAHYLGCSTTWSWAGMGCDTIWYPPVFPLWIAIVREIGLPLRLAGEVGLLAGAAAFVWSLRRIDISRGACLAVYALTIFHPGSIWMLDIAFADNLYAMLLLLALAALIPFVATPAGRTRLGAGLLSGLLLALLWHTRSEKELLLLLLGQAALTSLVLCRSRGGSWGQSLRRLAVTLAVPGLVLLAADLAVRSWTWSRSGLFVPCGRDARGYQAAYRALLRIKPPRVIARVPITTETRQLASQVSPAFRQMRDWIEDDSNHGCIRCTQAVQGINGEIGGGWLFLVLYGAAGATHPNASGPGWNAYLQQVADEINAAIDSGRLEGRPVPFTFIDPEWQQYLPHLGPSFARTAALLFEAPPPGPYSMVVDDSFADGSDDAATRRGALCGPGPFWGWAAVDGQSVDRVELRAPDGQLITTSSELTPRPACGDFPAGAAFKLPRLRGHYALEMCGLVVVSGSRTTALPWRDLWGRSEPACHRTAGGPTVYARLEQDPHPASSDWRGGIVARLVAYHTSLMMFLTAGGVVGLLVLLAGRRDRGGWRVYLLVGNLALVVAARLALFAVVDATSWPVEYRYVYPVMPLYITLLVVPLGEALRTLTGLGRPEAKTP